MSNGVILLFVVRILIVLTQTSDMSPVMKQARENRLLTISDEIERYLHD